MREVINNFFSKDKPKEEENSVFQNIAIDKNKIFIDVSSESIELGNKLKQKAIRVGSDFFDSPQIVGDIKTLGFFKIGSVDTILANNTLNTIERNLYQKALGNWCRVLKKGGMLHIMVPDIIDTIIRFNKGDIKDSKAVIDTVYGSRANYLNGFWFNRIERALRTAGFSKVLKQVSKKSPDKTTIYIKAIK